MSVRSGPTDPLDATQLHQVADPDLATADTDVIAEKIEPLPPKTASGLVDAKPVAFFRRTIRVYGQEISMAVIQLSVLGLFLAAAAVWTSNNPVDSSARDSPKAQEEEEGADEGASLSSGRSRSKAPKRGRARVIKRRVDLSRQGGSKEQSDGAELAGAGEQHFEQDMKAFAIPAISAVKVHQATERQLKGNRLFRRLQFEASGDAESMVSAYHRLLTERGYEMREMMLGQFGGGVTELIGQRGPDRLSAQIVPQSGGHHVLVTIEENSAHSGW